jgi:hypothetical protein
MVVGGKIKVIKIPRSDPIEDKLPNFPKLDNLFLEYEEFVEKTTKLSQTSVPPTVKQEDLPRYDAKGRIQKKNTVEVPKKSSTTVKKNTPSFEKEVPEDDDDMLKELGEEEDEGDNEEDDSEVELVNKLGEDENATKDGDEREPEEENEPPPPGKYDGMTPEEIEMAKREKYLNKLKILKKKWKKRADEVPNFTKYDNYTQIKTAYKSTFHEFILDDKIDTYRMYLQGAFYAAEFVGTMIGIDIEGFAEAQTQLMDKYDRMLIELGEKDMDRWNLNLPVEIKLIGFVIIQMGFFWFAKKLGGQEAINNIFSLITGSFKKKNKDDDEEDDSENKSKSYSKTKSKTKIRERERPTPKMKGPSINLEDLKKAAQNNNKQ